MQADEDKIESETKDNVTEGNNINFAEQAKD